MRRLFRLLPRGPFATGFLCACLLIFGGRILINETEFAD